MRSVLPDSSQVPIIKDRAGYVRPMSLSEAVNKNSQTMLDIQKKGGLQHLVGWVTGRLIELFSYLGAYDTVTDFQIQMLAQRICAKYFYITPGELDYFFLAFGNGEYRKLINNGRSINPQDIMQSLIEYEKDLLEERGRAEEKRMAEEEARRKAEEAKKPHGLAAWKQYCEQKGLDPDTHKLAAVKLRNVNEELYPERDYRGVIKNKQKQ